ncbi:hypothetical protein EST38_g12672 [Candolleomyces aberdarensis]|uniref:Uncharacterized protein n=1 Tax=Candolleomyces aberdarensis TaxID=2316362 RepID=A0A4Q2D1V5_9AGAR|nr:hypothetical protein EST38_g12672 [Candolleomyces aberdarensis]
MEHFHYDPFKVLWQPNPAAPPTRVYSELYNSDAFLKAHRELQDSPPPPGCTRPRVVTGLMFWSDETHLANFSAARLWPLYMFFGNESKYRCAKPSLNLCQHVAYFEKPSEEFQEFVTSKFRGRLPPKSFLAHCKMEMFHAQWEILLDDRLLDAIKNGIVLMCQDGIERRFYIRIFTYSADYPEKVLIATIRNIGDCPCPRCLVTKKNLDQLGTEADVRTRRDQARQDNEARRELVQKALSKIQREGAALSRKTVDDLLKPQSLQPVMNAFSKRLKSTKFDIFSALVVDLLHEFELGVWKSLFIHLIRILEASQKHEVLVHELDKCVRQDNPSVLLKSFQYEEEGRSRLRGSATGMLISLSLSQSSLNFERSALFLFLTACFQTKNTAEQFSRYYPYAQGGMRSQNFECKRMLRYNS